MAKVTAGITSPLLTPSVTPGEGQALALPALPWAPDTLTQEVEALVGQTQFHVYLWSTSGLGVWVHSEQNIRTVSGEGQVLKRQRGFQYCQAGGF